MKTNTRNYVVAGVYLAIIVTVIVAATYLGWNTLLYLIVLCLAGYGAYKLLEQTDVGQKILELVLVGPPVVSFCNDSHRCHDLSSRRVSGLVALVLYQ